MPFAKLSEKLAKTALRFSGRLSGTVLRGKLDEETLKRIGELLLQADLGTEMVRSLISALGRETYPKDQTWLAIRRRLADNITESLLVAEQPLLARAERPPFTIVMLGVNGSGKTTTAGKWACQFTEQGKTVVLAAADTFRAAAAEQLYIWAQRARQSTCIDGQPGADPASVAFRAFEHARKRRADILIIDTAGRMNTNQSLMDEVEKIIRVIKKLDADAPHAVSLVLDGSTGQNALHQVREFSAKASVSGLVVTKLDGTAKGGILVPIIHETQLPVYAIGLGENKEDLTPFNAREFAHALLGLDTTETE